MHGMATRARRLLDLRAVDMHVVARGTPRHLKIARPITGKLNIDGVGL